MRGSSVHAREDEPHRFFPIVCLDSTLPESCFWRGGGGVAPVSTPDDRCVCFR